jgi:hypothetical protein
MKATDRRGLLLGAGFSAVACLLQIVGLVRYLGRLPGDAVGIALYVVTIVAFGVGAVGFYLQWAKQDRDDRPHRPTSPPR